MKYLICKDKNGVDTYYTLGPRHEEKISTLIREKRIPETFELDGKTVISKNIIGFTNDRVSVAEQTSTSDGYERFRKSVREQEWYKRARGLTESASQASHQSDPITLVP